MTKTVPFTLTAAWQKIAAAGATVQVQTVSTFPAKLIEVDAGATPDPAALGEVLYSQDDCRKFDAALVGDLYAAAQGQVGGTLIVTPIGASGGSTTTADTIANGADVSEGATTDQPLATPTTAGTIQGVLRGIWARLNATLAVSDPNNASFGGPETTIAVGTTRYPVGRSLKIDCSVSGTITVVYADGSPGVWTIIAASSTQTLPLAIIGISAATATGTYANLK